MHIYAKGSHSTEFSGAYPTACTQWLRGRAFDACLATKCLELSLLEHYWTPDLRELSASDKRQVVV